MTKKKFEFFCLGYVIKNMPNKKKIKKTNFLFLLRTECISLCLVSLLFVSNERQTYLW